MNDKATILAVHDTSEALTLLVKILTLAGYQVRSADSGEWALAAVAAHPPDLILLDVRMKDVDGFEVCRRLKARKESRDIPIIFVSASMEMAERVKGLNLGAVDFITKPFQREELLARVQTHLELRHLRVRLEHQTADLQRANEQLQCELTERKRAEAEVQSARDYLANIINAIGDPVFVKDDRHRFVLVNDAECVLVGRSRADIIGKTDADFHPQEQVDVFWEMDDQVLRTGLGNVNEESIADARTSETRTIITRKTLYVAPGGNRFIVGVIRDNTERKRAEEALRRSETQFRSVWEQSRDSMRLTDGQGIVLLVNQAFCDLVGKTRCELEGQALTEIYAADLRPHIHQKFLERYARRAFEPYMERELRLWNGQEVWLAASTSLLDPDEPAPEVLDMFRDITERKQAETEKGKMEAQNRQLQKSESLGRMAGAIAHHFNNQLQAVMMSLELAKMALSRGVEPVENLNMALESARKAAEVSSLMLTYLGQCFAKGEPLDLSEACRRSLSLLRAVMPQRAVLETDLPSPGPAIHANANQIQQALNNLVTNAWEAINDERGSIRLTVKTVSATDIPAAHRFPIDWQPQDTAYACLEVADTGCGIADKEFEKIFDPFFSSKFVGRGLGLPVVLGIVRAHSGAVTVESGPGCGSVFRIFLPVSAETVPQRSEPVQTARAPRMSESGTVLVVDDEPLVRKSLKLVLKSLGYTVLAAADGVEAVEIFQQHRDEIHCVLTDLTMPRMSGWETLEALRKLKPGIRVILSSGFSKDRVMQGHHPELPQAFLSKPYEFNELADTLGKVLKSEL